MAQHSTFRNRVSLLAARSADLGKPKIGFGLKQYDEQIVASLHRGSNCARLVVVAPRACAVEGVELIASDQPEETLASLLASDHVEGIVRGTLDDFKTIEAYEKLTRERCSLVPALLENTVQQQFFIEPISNPDGWTKEERLLRVSELVEFVVKWEITPKIAVYAGVRHETYERRKGNREGVAGLLNQTYEDADWIVGELSKRGWEAKNCTIELDAAVQDGYNIHVPVNGMVGNQASRGVLAGGGAIVAVPRLGLSRLYEDNTRTEKDFEFHIQWLVAQINRRKLSQPTGRK